MDCACRKKRLSIAVWRGKEIIVEQEKVHNSPVITADAVFNVSGKHHLVYPRSYCERGDDCALSSFVRKTPYAYHRTGNLNCSSEHYPDSGARGADRDDCIPSCVVCFGIQDKYFPRESALCAMYPFARSSFLLLKHKVYLLTGYIRIIRSTDADVLLP